MPNKYPQEFKERAVRLVGDRLNHPDAPSITAAIKDIAPRLGISHNTLARWCNNAALDTGKEITTTSDAAAEIRRLKRENAELRRANEILKTASGFFRSRARGTGPMMIRFINTYKDLFGVEPICRVLSEHLDGGFMTASGYYRAMSRVASARSLSDQLLIPELVRIYQENYGVYGVRKMWQAMKRAGWAIGRDQTYRLMRAAGIQGVHRGRKPVTTRATKAPDHRPDLVNRQFTAKAPNRLWVADFTYVRTGSGFCYTAFITDVFSRKIVGWGVSSSMHTLGMPLMALKQALFEARRSGSDLTQVVHHSDRGSQYLADDYTRELRRLGVQLSVGSTGDSYDNALAESVNGAYKAELVRGRFFESVAQLEATTAGWVYWWNQRRLHASLGYRTPQEVVDGALVDVA
ncbi:IS3 family transposase [Rothia sp. 11254D007BW]